MAEMLYRMMEKITDKKSTTYENIKNGVSEAEYTEEEISDMAAEYHDNLLELDDEALGIYNAYIKVADENELDSTKLIAVEKERVKAVATLKIYFPRNC